MVIKTILKWQLPRPSLPEVQATGTSGAPLNICLSFSTLYLYLPPHSWPLRGFSAAWGHTNADFSQFINGNFAKQDSKQKQLSDSIKYSGTRQGSELVIP